VVAAHGVGGTVGALLTRCLRAEGVELGGRDGLLFGNPGQVGIQALAIATAIVYSGVMSFVLLKVIGLVMPLRPSRADEMVGPRRLDARRGGVYCTLKAKVGRGLVIERSLIDLLLIVDC
jgi:ammonia channel protein AmtB